MAISPSERFVYFQLSFFHGFAEYDLREDKITRVIDLPLSDVSEAMRHLRTINSEIRALGAKSEDELYVAAKEIAAPYHLVRQVASLGRLPVVTFVAGGIATPADAAMMMQLGADGVFVGSGIFKSGDPAKRAAAIVRATARFDDPGAIAEASRGLGEAMVGINVADLPAPHRLAARGW